MKIIIYGENDIKKSGGFKKKNNIKEMNKNEFKSYIKDNNLTLSKGYIDDKGFISNGLRFRCFYKNLIIGVTDIIQEVEK